MKFMVLGAVGALALSACTMEGGSTISTRSYEQVSNSLQQGASQCLNGTFAAASMTMGGGMVSNSAWTVGLDTSVSTSGNQTVLQTQRTLLTGAIGAGPDNTATWVSATATPAAGGGADLQVSGRWGSEAIQRAIRHWASTGQITCPDIE